jgi:serine-threonine kinase receptor-associated protein
MAVFFKQQPLVCSGHSRPVVNLSYSNIIDGTYFLISSCVDAKPMVRHGETGDWVGTLEGHKGAVWSAELDSTARQAVTASADFSCKVWSALTGEELSHHPHPHIVKAVAWAPDDARFVSGGQDKIVRVFDLGSAGKDAVSTLSGHAGPVKTIKWLRDGNTLLSGGADKVVKVWDARTGACSRTLDGEAALAGPITSMEVSRDGASLVVTGGKEVLFFSLPDLTLVKRHKVSFDVDSASLHEDRSRYVAGGHDNWIHIFDYETGKEIEVHQGHHGPIHSVAYAPGGKSYASGSDDGTVRIWRTFITAEDIERAEAARKDKDETAAN